MEENEGDMEKGVKEKQGVQASPVSAVLNSKWFFLKVVPEGASCLMLCPREPQAWVGKLCPDSKPD